LSVIPAGEYTLAFVRSPGPGGQNVNKVATACELRFRVGSTSLLDEAGKARLRAFAGRRLTRDDEIVLEAHRHRSQEANRRDALQRLQLPRARDELALAQAEEPQGVWSWWVPYQRGVVAERMGELEAAAELYAAAVAAVRDITSGAGLRGAEVIATYRQPFQRLFGLRARAGDAVGAFEVVMQLDASALVTAEASPTTVDDVPVDLRGPPTRATVPPARDVIEAWRGRRLVIVMSDGDRLWRVEVRDGGVALADVGAVAELEGLARTLEVDPSDGAAAEQLGAASVPPDVSGEPLDVLLVGPIARAPLALLARGAPLRRVLGVLPAAAVSHQRSRAVVLGDPRGDLAAARAEAVAVARAVGVDPALGGDASWSALERARGADVLHVASHSQLAADGPTLLLADRVATVEDIRALTPAPRLVVLASCGSAAARDDSGWGSLAGAFLHAGAEVVLASAWSVDDAATQRLVEAFYRHGGVASPHAALAAAQRELAPSLAPRDWAGFTILAAPPRN
jgi:hypothetical protein